MAYANALSLSGSSGGFREVHTGYVCADPRAIGCSNQSATVDGSLPVARDDGRYGNTSFG